MPVPLQPPLIGTVYLHAAMVAAVLVALTVPIALRLARREGQPWLVPLILGSLFLHFAGAVLQIIVVRIAYDNVADFHLYDGQGAALAEAWRQGVFSLDHLQLPGTDGVVIATGLVYSVFGVDQLGGFFVFSWLSLIGLIAFYRAFRIALPSGQHGRYAVLIFLLPSLFFWPSAAGKEAVMMLALGAMALGAARLLRGEWQGTIPAVAGSLLGAAVRPHEVALVYGSFGVALLTRPVMNRSLVTPIRIGITLLIVVVGGGTLAWFTARFLGITSFSGEAIARAVNDAAAATQGEGEGFGSSHDTWRANPIFYPVDVYIVLFRPLPFEVASPTQAIAALENLTIIALIAFCWRSIAGTGRQLRRSPFVLMCAVYSATFLYLFSALGNEGLLARERTLLFPFLFVLFALPAWPPRPHQADDQPPGARPWRVSTLLRQERTPDVLLTSREGA
jgi:hypothetical protein